MSGRRPYVRPMKGWWLKNPFYIRYMVRESTSVFVTLYALVMLTGLMSLQDGESSWQTWLRGMNHPMMVVFHVFVLAACLYHAVTWFKVAPKVAPNFFIAGKRIPDIAITAVQYLIAVACYLFLYCVIWRM